jgi:tetraacyldisaccharide 4'-kinase
VTAKRPWLLPLVPGYWAAVSVKNLLFDWGWLRASRLARPVISVGSVSAGGAGKTPVVMMLAKLLETHGVRVDVLSRGYGRSSNTVEPVPFDSLASPEEFGDEPVEMMRSGLHVFVGAVRYEAGLLAERSYDAAVHLLDDGFQHRRLARQLEIVLFTLEDAEDSLLPAGNRREPFASLRRADVVILREEESDALRALLSAWSKAEVWVIRRELVFQEEIAHPFAFCGIARPGGFLKMLRDAGREPVGSLIFPDHHPYTDADGERIVESAKVSQADGFYITEKDAVKLSREFLQHLQTVGPVHAPSLQVSLVDSQRAMERMLAVMHGA